MQHFVCFGEANRGAHRPYSVCSTAIHRLVRCIQQVEHFSKKGFDRQFFGVGSTGNHLILAPHPKKAILFLFHLLETILIVSNIRLIVSNIFKTLKLQVGQGVM